LNFITKLQIRSAVKAHSRATTGQKWRQPLFAGFSALILEFSRIGPILGSRARKRKQYDNDQIQIGDLENG
jgi:hypothetical protein